MVSVTNQGNLIELPSWSYLKLGIAYTVETLFEGVLRMVQNSDIALGE